MYVLVPVVEPKSKLIPFLLRWLFVSRFLIPFLLLISPSPL